MLTNGRVHFQVIHGIIAVENIQKGGFSMIDQVKVGTFIAQLRKEYGLTQKQLGEFLSVSDKAVSKWEHGRSLPDVSLIEPMCELFQISISELLAGEKMEAEEIQKETNKVLLEAVSDRQIWGIQVVVKLLYTGGMALWTLPFINGRFFGTEMNFTNIVCWVIGILLLFSYTYLDNKLRLRYYRNSLFGITLVSSTLALLIIISPVFAGWREQDPETQRSALATMAILYGILVVLLFFHARRNKKKSREE